MYFLKKYQNKKIKKIKKQKYLDIKTKSAKKKKRGTKSFLVALGPSN
jgi:hypothetical protein